jgi:hypothetical protein
MNVSACDFPQPVQHGGHFELGGLASEMPRQADKLDFDSHAIRPALRARPR